VDPAAVADCCARDGASTFRGIPNGEVVVPSASTLLGDPGVDDVADDGSDLSGVARWGKADAAGGEPGARSEELSGVLEGEEAAEEVAELLLLLDTAEAAAVVPPGAAADEVEEDEKAAAAGEDAAGLRVGAARTGDFEDAEFA